MEEPIGTPTRVSHGVLLEQLAQLSGRRLSLTGRLKKVGQNGSTRFILRDLGIDIQGKGNEPSAKLGPLIRNYAELDVPDEIISNNRAGALVPVSGIVSSEDLATLHPNACLVLTGVNARRVSLAILKKASGMLRLVQKPTREIDTKGFHPRDFRQAFALGLLVDPDIRLVALSGIAGTGKTSLALLAGLRAIGKLPVGQHKEPTFSNKVEVPLSLEQSKIGSPQQSPVRILVCRSVHTIGKELGFRRPGGNCWFFSRN